MSPLAANYLLKIMLTRFIIFTIASLPNIGFCERVIDEFVNAAIERTKQEVTYDGSYFSIGYPNGDIPQNLGVCTDVVIRSYRTIGIDLQKLVHEDMLAHFNAYPSKRNWGLSQTDKNIDHRRVPNLKVFFSRKGTSLPISSNKNSYLAGDIVTWILPGNLPHIGIISNQKSRVTENPLVVHNIGVGPKIEDMLFKYKISGHYSFMPERM